MGETGRQDWDIGARRSPVPARGPSAPQGRAIRQRGRPSRAVRRERESGALRAFGARLDFTSEGKLLSAGKRTPPPPRPSAVEPAHQHVFELHELLDAMARAF